MRLTAALAPHATQDMEAKHRKRHDLKSRIRQLESALITEKRATMALESEINGMRGSD